MVDFATLGMRVDTSDLKKGERAQDSFARKAEQTEGKTTKATAAISSGFRRMVPAITGAIAALGAGVGIAAAIREAEKFQTTMFRVEAVIKATGGAAGRSADQLREQARQIALGTLESTEGVLRAQQTLLTFRKVQGDVFDRAIVAAADMTAALGGDLNSATLQLAKALENPLEGISALSRSGTVFTAAQKDMVRAMVEAGQTAEAQAFILDELEAQYKGTAEAAAGGLAGAQDTLGQAMQELKLVIGNALLPTMMELVKIATGIVNGFASMTRAVGAFFSAIGGMDLWKTQVQLAMIATDNLTLSMGDEITAINELAAVMNSESTMTIAFARDKLTQAQSHLAVAAAAREETQSLIDNQVALLELERIRRMDALGVLRQGTEAYEAMEQSIANAITQQRDLRAIVSETNAAYDAAVIVVDEITGAIVSAENGIVTFGNGVVTATGLTQRLDASAQLITFDGANAGALALAEKLGISLGLAQRIEAVGGSAGASGPDAAVQQVRNAYGDIDNMTGSIVNGIRGVVGQLTITGSAASTAITSAGASVPNLVDPLREVEPTIDAATDAFQDFGKDGIQQAVDWMVGGFKGGLDTLKDMFLNTLRQMIATAAKNKIVIPMMAAMSPTGAAANTLLGAGGGMSGVGSALGALGTFGTSVGTGLSVVGSGFAAGGLGGAATAGMGAITGGIGAGGAIGFGTALGAAIPFIGAAAVVFMALRKTTKELDSGLRGTVKGFDTAIETFRKTETSRFFGLSKSRSTSYKDDPDNPLHTAIGDIQTAVADAAATLGFGSNIFDQFTYDFKLSLKGLSEDQKLAKINEELSKMGDEFASLVPGMASMNEVINAANEAVARAGSIGTSLFESQMLMAAARRGEITVAGAGPGGTRTEDLIRRRDTSNVASIADAAPRERERAEMKSLFDILKSRAERNEKSEGKNGAIFERMLRIWERFEIDGIPQGPVVE